MALFTSLGSGVRWRHEKQVMANLPPMTVKQFRRLCKRLCIPLIRAPKGTYVDHLSLCLVLRYISRIGAPSFLLPGSLLLRKYGAGGAKLRGYAVDMDLEDFLAVKEQMISELVAAARIAGIRLPDDFSRESATAAGRIAALSALIPFARRAREDSFTDRVHDLPDPHLPEVPLPPSDYTPPVEGEGRPS